MLLRLLALFAVGLAASSALVERNTLCDDGEPLDKTCHVPNAVSDSECGGSSALLALQAGCYLCVDATTCLALDTTLMKGQRDSLSLPKANGNDISVLLEDQADHTPEQPAYEQAAKSTQAQYVSNEDSAKRPEVSNWLFSIPVCLAVVSLGLAIRARIPQRRRGFQRLQDNNRPKADVLFQEDINPFCSNNECEENIAIETAGHFRGDPGNSENEEAHFLSSGTEQDEFTQAESEAIKQAVLLHIKEFDEEEEVEI
ncbi:hypothetical protein PHMEG_0007875 [Phytophthora megakarya]|uniref:Uncharacterized protein n=1 Tax=Phytophthora megakarya TaxID=4795 RepID=A0A225WLF5_9STRA|nr:hypothetical protein PHMEG_0007875 [Phytophthora megakarya]